jgi:hypothetical protein
MAEAVETIEVIWSEKFGKDPVRINAADFDPKIHKRVEPTKEPAPKLGTGGHPIGTERVEPTKEPAPKLGTGGHKGEH